MTLAGWYELPLFMDLIWIQQAQVEYECHRNIEN